MHSAEHWEEKTKPTLYKHKCTEPKNPFNESADSGSRVPGCPSTDPSGPYTVSVPSVRVSWYVVPDPKYTTLNLKRCQVFISFLLQATCFLRPCRCLSCPAGPRSCIINARVEVRDKAPESGFCQQGPWGAALMTVIVGGLQTRPGSVYQYGGGHGLGWRGTFLLQHLDEKLILNHSWSVMDLLFYKWWRRTAQDLLLRSETNTLDCMIVNQRM